MGALVLLGWLLDWQALKSGLPDLPAMKANTAVILVLLSTASLLFASRASSPRRRIGIGLVLVALTLASATLAEYVLGRGLGIDELLFRDATAPAGLPPGRPALPTTVAFTMLGLGLLLSLSRDRRARWAADASGHAAFATGLIMVIGYAYSVASFYSFPRSSGSALHSAFGILLLATALLAANGMSARWIAGSNPGALLLQRVIPAILAVVIGGGALIVFGQGGALEATSDALAAFAVLSLALLTGVTVWTSRVVDRIAEERAEHQGRLENERRVALLAEVAPDGLLVVDPNGRVSLANAAAARLFGVPRDALAGRLVVELFSPETRAHLTSPEGARFEVEAEALQPGGESLPVDVAMSRADGALILSVRDASARRRAEELARSQAVSRTIVRRFLRPQTQESIFRSNLRDSGRRLAATVEGASLEEYAHAFAAMGLGELVLEERKDHRYHVRGDDLLERTQRAKQPTCLFALGFLEGAVGALHGGDGLGAEVACQSQGAPACEFVVSSRPRPAAPRKPAV